MSVDLYVVGNTMVPFGIGSYLPFERPANAFNHERSRHFFFNYSVSRLGLPFARFRTLTGLVTGSMQGRVSGDALAFSGSCCAISLG